MIEETAKTCACQSEEIAAYLDGELDCAARAVFELHLTDCLSCASQLEEQKRLLCTLDFALGGSEKGLPLPMPKDFAQVVAAHAESDMSGVRRASEHRVALRACAVLALVSFGLLGGAAISEAVVKPVFVVFKHVLSVMDFAGRVLFDAGAGLAVISRDVGGHMLFESHPLGLLACLLLALALALILRRISHHQGA